MNLKGCMSLFVLMMSCSNVGASLLGDVRGVVRDPQRRLIKDAKITLHARASEFSVTALTDDDGLFLFRTVPIGEYLITVEAGGFKKIEQPLTVVSGSSPMLQFQLEVAPLSQSVDIVASPELIGSDSPTPTTLVSRAEIERTPGAARSNSLSMITNYTPGAYVTHDQSHIR